MAEIAERAQREHLAIRLLQTVQHLVGAHGQTVARDIVRHVRPIRQAGLVKRRALRPSQRQIILVSGDRAQPRPDAALAPELTAPPERLIEGLLRELLCQIAVAAEPVQVAKDHVPVLQVHSLRVEHVRHPLSPRSYQRAGICYKNLRVSARMCEFLPAPAKKRPDSGRCQAVFYVCALMPFARSAAHPRR